MGAATATQRGMYSVGPTAPEELRRLSRLLRPKPVAAGEPPRPLPKLVGSNGEEMHLPPAIYELLSNIVPRIMRGEEIVLLREDKPLTTQQAADLLGMSRPFLKRLLDEEQIPFYRVGTHRRLRLADVMRYKERRDAERHGLMADLVAFSEELGAYD